MTFTQPFHRFSYCNPSNLEHDMALVGWPDYDIHYPLLQATGDWKLWIETWLLWRFIKLSVVVPFSFASTNSSLNLQPNKTSCRKEEWPHLTVVICLTSEHPPHWNVLLLLLVPMSVSQLQPGISPLAHDLRARTKNMLFILRRCRHQSSPFHVLVT